MPISTPASRDDLQRVPIAPKDYPRTVIPSSKQPAKGEALGIRNLLNPIEGEDHSIASNAIGSPSLSELNTSLLGPLGSQVHDLPPARSSPYHRERESRKHLRAVSPEPLQPISQRENPSTQYSSDSQFSQTESVIAPIIASTGQPQHIPLNPSSGLSSSILQLPPSTKTFKVPTLSTAAQSQYQMMVRETGRTPIQLPVNLDQKRQRNAAASHRFRQRRKEKAWEVSKNVAKLEAQVRETEKERDHYRTERDHFRDLAFRHRLPVTHRPSTPEHQRYAAINGALPIQNQESEGDGQNGIHTRRTPRVPSQDLLLSAAWPPLQMPIFRHVN